MGQKNKDLKELEEFASGLRMFSLGDLVDKLIQYRIEESFAPDDESITDKSKRTLRMGALKKELSRRETGREDGESSIPKGVTSLGSMF